MTIREYVSQILQAFNVTEAVLTDMEGLLQMSLDDEYMSDIAPSVGKALAQTLEGLILAPRLSNVNESGFSMSWDFTNLGSYYLYLCRRWGVKANEDVLAASGMSAITDKTDMW